MLCGSVEHHHNKTDSDLVDFLYVITLDKMAGPLRNSGTPVEQTADGFLSGKFRSLCSKKFYE
jgi:hypothetical protein